MNVKDDVLHDLASCFLSSFTCLSGERERERARERKGREEIL